MSSGASGANSPPLMGYRRRRSRRTMPDLNVPPSENGDREDAFSQNAQPSQQEQSMPPVTVDVEALDDDVIESSPRAFAEAKSNAQRNNAVRTRASAVVVDVDSGRTTRLAYNNQNKRGRNQTVINCDQLVNLESSSSSKRNVVQPPPPPPKELTFSCPVCMAPLKEETSTKCGHIFCKECIKAAIKVQARCPTCRKKVTVKELIRVFLPTTSSL